MCAFLIPRAASFKKRQHIQLHGSIPFFFFILFFSFFTPDPHCFCHWQRLKSSHPPMSFTKWDTTSRTCCVTSSLLTLLRMQQPHVLGDACSPGDPAGSPPVGKQEHAEKQEKDLTVQSSVIGSDVKVTLSSSDIGNIASTSETAWRKEFNLLEEHWQHPSKVFWEMYCSSPVTV